MVSLFYKLVGNFFATPKLAVLLLSLTLISCSSLRGSISYPDIFFLGWDENDQTQLYRFRVGENIKQLTATERGIVDYNVTSDGMRIAYTVSEENGSSSIWQMTADGAKQSKILDCSSSLCAQPVWSPVESRLLFEQSEIGSDGIAGEPTLWWLDVQNGESWPLLEDSQAYGNTARFSPIGNWVSYFSHQDDGVFIYNFEDGRSQFFPSEVGMPAAWSPNSDQVILPDLDLVIIHGDEGDDHFDHTHDYQSATHLFIADIETGSMETVSDDLNVEDTVPSWSPDGQWIAFGRRPAKTGAGRQLWLMRPDGTDARALTNDPDVNYGPPLWSPDGRFLLFQRLSLLEPQKEPGIWALDIESGEQNELVMSGMQPQLVNPKNR